MSVDLRTDPTVEPLDEARWRALIDGFRDHRYQLTWAYGETTAAARGAHSEHVGILRGEEVLGLAEVRVKRMPGLPTGIAYLGWGPVVRRYGAMAEEEDARRLGECLGALRAEYAQRRGYVLRVRTPIGHERWNRLAGEAFASQGFLPTAKMPPYRSFLLDVTLSEEELRKGLDRKWRNHLKRSEKQGLRVERGTSPALWASFEGLYDELRERKGFEADQDARFFFELQSRLREEEKLQVFLASLEDDPIAGVVVSVHGDTGIYLLGASTEAGRRARAAYLLQWRVMLELGAQGIARYDLGGIDPEANPGVYSFKRGMGGVDVLSEGPFEATPGAARTALVRLGEGAFRLAARLRHR